MNIKLPDGSGTRYYKHVWADIDRHGNERIYFARKGKPPKVRLLEAPGTEAFEREYYRALRGERALQPMLRTPIKAGSLQWLSEQYCASGAFRALHPSTRVVRRRILEQICDELTQDGERVGALPYKAMQASHVVKLRNKKLDAPEAANSRVKALRQLYAWACKMDSELPEEARPSHNPATGIQALAPNNPDGHKAWAREALEQYRARHPLGTKARKAVDLLAIFGLRVCDVVRVGPQNERWIEDVALDGGIVRVQKLVFEEAKGRGRNKEPKRHALPILPVMRQSLDAAPSGHLTYLVTEFGRPYSEKGFGNWFKRRCREAGIDEELSAHGLRKLAAATMAENGATEEMLKAYFGWRTSKQANHYTRSANRQRLEAQAATFLDREPMPTARIVRSPLEGNERRKWEDRERM